MGGPMSVNDALPWIAPALALVADAARKDVPVLGHCLGGQLMAKALGGAVRATQTRPCRDIAEVQRASAQQPASLVSGRRCLNARAHRPPPARPS